MDLSTGSATSVRANIWLVPSTIIQPLALAATGQPRSVNELVNAREASLEMLLKFSMKDWCLSMSSGETGMEVAAGVGVGIGAAVAVGVGRRPGAAVTAGVGEEMFGTALAPCAGPEVAVGSGGREGKAIVGTVVGPSTATGVAAGASPCICRCCGSVAGCSQAVAPIANISSAKKTRIIGFSFGIRPPTHSYWSQRDTCEAASS